MNEATNNTHKETVVRTAEYDDISKLSQLGSNTTYKYDKPCADILETFPNNNPNNGYEIYLDFPEFSSLCPKTGQPDFAHISIKYVPDKQCVESKSLKLYFFAYRSQGAFMETITNKILDDFVQACSPRYCEVVGNFAPRGALKIVVKATYTKE